MLKFWVPMGLREQEVLLPPETAELLTRVAVHEVGHAEVACHFGARILGIALALETQGLTAMAIYVLPDNLEVDQIATIYAAGPAAEMLEFGSYKEDGASADRQDMKRLGNQFQFEGLVEKATGILTGRKTRFDRITKALKEKLFNSDNHLTMGPLPNGRLGAFVMSEDDFDDSYRAAAHEAGHTVVGMSLGLNVDDIRRCEGSDVPGSLQAVGLRAAVVVRFTNLQQIEPRLQYLLAVGGMAAETLIYGNYDRAAATFDLDALRPIGLSEPEIDGLIRIARLVLQENLEFLHYVRTTLEQHINAPENILIIGACLNAKFKECGQKTDVFSDLDRLLPT
jgi:hypothetical protein